MITLRKTSCFLGTLAMASSAFAQVPPTSPRVTPESTQCGPANAQLREQQVNQLAVSVRFASATENCDNPNSPGDCRVLTCLRAGQTVGGNETEAAEAIHRFLRAGASASATANGTLNDSLSVEENRPLGESVETIANATALFEAFTQGLAGFLINRARLEMQRTALERLRTNVCAPGVNLLTNTCGFLGDSGAETTDSSARGSTNLANVGATFGAGLQTAFQRDVLGLPQWLLDNGGLTASTDAVAAQRLSLRLMASLMQQSDPLAVASALLSESRQWTADSAAVTVTRDALRAYRVIALAMAASAGSQTRVSLGTRAQMVQLLLGGALGVPIDDTRLPQCMEIARSAWDAQRASQEMGSPSLSDAQRRARIATLAFNFVTAIRATFVLINDLGQRPQNTTDFLSGLSATIAVFEAMATSDIARVYSSMVGVFRLIARQGTLIPAAHRQALSWLAAGAEFAAARTPQQMEAAITAFAAPPGSWQAKLDQPGVWINGFVGVGGGGEMLFNGHANGQLGGYIAPNLSVGIDLTRPVGDRSWAVGLYIPVLDLGALANASSASLSSTNAMGNTMTLPARVSPGQFLAPGLYARVNFGRSPIVLAVGASVLPFGREVEVAPGMFENANSLRFGATLSADIPIVPLSF